MSQAKTTKSKATATATDVQKSQGASQPIVPDVKENTVQEAQTDRKRHPGPWVKMPHAKIEKHSIAGNVIGHDPRTGEVILLDPDLEVEQDS